jgi:glucose/arabinose dehydrogenase
MHPFIIDTSGALFVDLGSATNSCQVHDRVPKSLGHDPCTELRTRGGIWKYDAKKTGQKFSAEHRYATGLRNSEGYAINPQNGKFYSTQHGRDQLHDNFPERFTAEQSAELPAEEIVEVVAGGDYGWPYCYFDGRQGKLVLAPEYGGDGNKVGRCASKRAPIAWLPAHYAPDDLLFYHGTLFPDHYRGGAFIAFHGSWNRAPLPQGGYNVTFVPWSAHPDSTHEDFATGFAGATMQPDRAEHRPAGLAEGPDGALYVADDQGGRVYRITYGR